MYINDKVITVDGLNGIITNVGYPELDGNERTNWFWVTMEQTGKEVLYKESELFLF